MKIKLSAKPAPAVEESPAQNALAVLVSKSSLEEATKASLLAKFQDFFQIADDWNLKAKAIQVNDASQVAEMQMARAGRLFLREKRISVEKTRKELKEESLQKGRAIDSIAKVLTELIEPIEKHLDEQEHWVEIQARKEVERIQAEITAKAEAARLAQEKADAEEQERMRLENVRLKAEAVEREKALAEERRKAAEAQAAADAEAEAIRQKANAHARAAKAKADAKLAAAEAQARKEIAALAAAQKVKDEAARQERELRNTITCPKCGTQINTNHQKKEVRE